MKTTSNFKLNKPDYTDTADIADINENMDIIDQNLGQVTIPTYTDSNGNKYADINGMHLRLDNAPYIEGGIKIVKTDPCKDGSNITEDIVTGENSNQYVTAKIDENGNAVLCAVDADNIGASAIEGDTISVNALSLNENGIHFNKAKGAIYNDNSKNIGSDGSRKLLIGTYRNTPKTDSNNIPTTLPNSGIRFRIESDDNGNDTYAEIYGKNIVCRTDGATFKTDTVRANTVKAVEKLYLDGESVSELIAAKADTEHLHSKVSSNYTEYSHADSIEAETIWKIAEIPYNADATSIISDIYLGTKYKSTTRSIATVHSMKFSFAISAADMFYYKSGTGVHIEQFGVDHGNIPFVYIVLIMDSDNNVNICLKTPTNSTSNYLANWNNYKFSVNAVNYLSDGISVVTPAIYTVADTDTIILTREISLN